MTKEEKAKAYDEALKQAKKFHTPDSNNSNLKAVLELIFPELVESEDERIRSCICLALTDVDEQRFTDFGVTLKDCLTYLEKQKEQKPTECIEDSVEFKEGFKAGRDSGLRDGQKYVLDDLDSYGLCKLTEWSEEDERILNEIIETIEATRVEALRDLPNCSVLQESYWTMLRWLKSLRPSWKPSEEQIWALQAIINDPNNAGAESCQLAIKSLLEHLKNGEAK